MRLLVCMLACSAGVWAQNAEALLSQGVEQFQKGKYPAALDTFEAVLKLSPADARAIAYEQLTRAVLGDCSRTVNELVLQAKRNPDPALRRLSGIYAVRCLTAHNEFPEALQLLADLMNRNPGDAEVIFEASQTFYRAYNYSVYEMFQRDPSSYRANQISAEILESQGRFDQAVAQLQAAIAKNPAALQLHQQLGRALLKTGSTAEVRKNAQAAFEAEVALNPQNSLAQYELGQVLASEEKPDAASACFEKALQLRPLFPEALVSLAQLRREAKQPEAAIKLLRRALEIQPALESAHQELIRIFNGMGKIKDAQREQTELDRQRKAMANESLDKLKVR